MRGWSWEKKFGPNLHQVKSGVISFWGMGWGSMKNVSVQIYVFGWVGPRERNFSVQIHIKPNLVFLRGRGSISGHTQGGKHVSKQMYWGTDQISRSAIWGGATKKIYCAWTPCQLRMTISLHTVTKSIQQHYSTPSQMRKLVPWTTSGPDNETSNTFWSGQYDPPEIFQNYELVKTYCSI